MKPDEGVVGCVNNGIMKMLANKIYDEMIDFAKYAFNKSHAAAYAVVAFRRHILNYYPVEFMAAMLTSVMEERTRLPNIFIHQWEYDFAGYQ